MAFAFHRCDTFKLDFMVINEECGGPAIHVLQSGVSEAVDEVDRHAFASATMGRISDGWWVKRAHC